MSFLPVGWKRYEKIRDNSATVGRVHVYISSPNSHIFSLKKKLEQYVNEKKLNQFDFKFSSNKNNIVLTSTSMTSSPLQSTVDKNLSDLTSPTSLIPDINLSTIPIKTLTDNTVRSTNDRQGVQTNSYDYPITV